MSPSNGGLTGVYISCRAMKPLPLIHGGTMQMQRERKSDARPASTRAFTARRRWVRYGGRRWELLDDRGDHVYIGRGRGLNRHERWVATGALDGAPGEGADA